MLLHNQVYYRRNYILLRSIIMAFRVGAFRIAAAAKLAHQAVCQNASTKSLHISATAMGTKFNQPLSGYDMPRSGGIATTFRLPHQENKPEGLDACFVGIPMDNGVSGRTGTRLAPRQIRNESTIIRSVNMTGAAPFESLQVADIGDVPVVPFNLKRTVDIITDHYRRIAGTGCIPITMGGDHTLTYPILRAMKEKYGRVAMIQIDAHTDLYDNMMGEKLAHSTPFRRALEEDLLSPEHVYQIGLRGSMYSLDEYSEVYEWAQNLGLKMVFANECWHRSLEPLMAKIRKELGDMPVYLTFDIDAIDSMDCPGTGTLETAGLTPIQALEIVQGCRGLNLVGADVVEVNPLFDPSGATANMGANLLFEILCVLPGVKYFDSPKGNFEF